MIKELNADADKLLEMLREFIDAKWKRKKRGKFVCLDELRSQMTLYALSGYLSEHDPAVIVRLLKELIAAGFVTTNMDEDGVYPMDAYFVPTAELVNEKNYRIYRHYKKIML